MPSCLSNTIYSFFTPTVSQAYNSPSPLTLDDLAPLRKDANVNHIRSKLFEIQKGNIGLAYSLFTIALPQLSVAALLLCIKIAADLSFPLFLRYQLDAIENQTNDGWIWAIAGIVSTAFAVISNQKHIDLAFRQGIRLKAVCSVLVFDTALYRTSAALDNRGDTTGKILNLVSSDAAKLQELAPLFNLLWAAPLQIVIATILITQLIGISGFIGVAFLGIGMPALNYLMIAKIVTYRQAKMNISDERVKLSSEMLAGIRVVKFLSWEARFVERILKVRTEEMVWVSKELHLFATYVCILISFPMLSLLVCFGSYVLINPEIPLTAGNAFAALSLFNVLRFPLMQMGTVLSAAAQAKVAVQRIESFLAKSEHETKSPTALVSGEEEEEEKKEKEEKKESQDIKEIKEENKIISKEIISKETIQNKKYVVASFNKAEFVWSSEHTSKSKSSSSSSRSSTTSSTDIQVKDMEQATSSTSNQFSLGPINVQVMSGDLIAVVGVVGCGKSMFISSLLGETHMSNGTGKVSRALSYVPQAAWIINASIRENITTFVYSTEENKQDTTTIHFDEKLYNTVLKACALDRDILEMPDKDQQVIGERGVTLSGGQKQRIAIARATYSILMSQKLIQKQRKKNTSSSSSPPPPPSPPLLLLDDPLSALDAHTSRHIFDAVLGSNGLLKDVARILVTHAVQFLGQCNSVYLIHSSTVTNLGHFADINQTIHRLQEDDKSTDNTNNSTNQELINVIRQLSQTSQEDGNKKKKKNNNQQEEEILRLRSLSTSSVSSINSLSSMGSSSKKNTFDAASKKGKELMTTEHVEKGTIGFQVIKYMTTTWGTACTFFIPLGTVFVLERTTYVMTDWWLSIWTAASNSTPVNGLNLQFPAAPHPEGQQWYAGWYAVFVLSAAVFVVGRLHGFATGFVKTAEKMFRRLLQSTVKAPMIFFETTPLGRITNRFSFDTEVIDSQLFSRINGVVASTSWLIGGMGVMIGTLPWMAAILFPVLVVYYFLYRFYRKACVEIQRLSAITRSPIHSTFQEALQGADSIRAFNVQQRYVAKNRTLVDNHSRAMVAMEVAFRWLSTRLESLGVVVVAGASLLAYYFRFMISPGMAGLAIMWANTMSISLNYNTVNLTEAESLLTSVERMLEYIVDIEHEPESITEKAHQPVPEWPMKGEIIFQDCIMSYRDDLPPALCGLSVHIKGGQRIGIVGRTGAGKSTIATALFRLRELTSGCITVDGIDISTLGLSDVRGRNNGMAIITQDPLVFSGPIRMTLDPFNNHTNEEIWSALEAVQMKQSILVLWSKQDSKGNEDGDGSDVGEDREKTKTTHNDDALQLPIAEAGRNLSVGQRQLLCFARALLLKPKILILDEATASVDYQTDHLIQLTLRKLFEGTTMLVVAHRLQTIIDLDAVLVMEEGRCVEFDTAATLLEDESSFFSGLVDATGVESSKMLRQQAIEVQQGKVH